MSSKKVTISPLRRYVEAGWGFVKLHHWMEKDENGKSLAKVPSDLWGKGTKPLTYDEVALLQEDATFNVGAVIPRGWIVVDIDPRNLEPGMTVNKIARKLGLDMGDEDFQWPLVRSGSGGVHILCRVRDGVKLRKENKVEFKGVDIKQFGGYVVAAGSIHDSGNQYVIEHTPAGGWASAGFAPPEVLKAFESDGLPVNRFGLSADELRQTYGRVSPEGVEFGLSHLDPTKFDSNDTWFNLMCSVHWASGGAAEEEFVAWSLSDPNYADHEELIRTRWESLGQGDPTAVAIRSGYFFKCLKEAGCNIHDRRFQLSAMDDFADLTPDEMQEYLGGKTQKEMVVRDKIAGTTLAGLLRDYFVVNMDGRAAISTIRSGSDGRKIEFLEPRSFNLMYANVRESDGTASSQAWMESPLRRTYFGIDFLPDEPPGEVYERSSGKFIYNLWTGFELEPQKGDWSQFRRLLLEGLCDNNEAYLDFFLNWCAYKYQNLGGPVGVAVVIRGKKGVGKSTIWEVFSAPFGSAALATARSEDVFGSHNSLMLNKIALCLEEAFWSGNHSVGSQLKHIVTNPKLTVNPKFLPQLTVRNNLANMILTNEGWSVPATEDERRYFCMMMSDVFKKDHTFWESIYDKNRSVKGEIKRAFFYDMLHRDISSFNPYRDVPVTEELASQIRQSNMRSASKAMFLWVQDRLNEACVEVSPEYLHITDSGIVRVLIEDAYTDYRGYVERQGLGRYVNHEQLFKTTFEKELKELFPLGGFTTVNTREKRAVRAFRIGTKENLRQRYEYLVGGSKDVDDDDDL